MGSTVFVDSAPLIYFLEGHPSLASKFDGLFEDIDRGLLHMVTSSISLAEILAGPLRHGKHGLAKRYEAALMAHEVLSITPNHAVAAALFRTQYKLALPDALQLSCALSSGASALVTHDRDFRKVEGIRVIDGNSTRPPPGHKPKKPAR